MDGSHSADDVLEDAVLCWRLLKNDGLLIFEDYRWNTKQYDSEMQTKTGIDSFYRLFSKHFQVIYNSYQVILKKQYQARKASTWS